MSTPTKQTVKQTVQTKLIAYLKERGCIKASIVNGPNGDFISATKEGFVDKSTTPDLMITLPVGKRSQSGTLTEMNVIITDDGAAIATMNNYEVVEEISL